MMSLEKKIGKMPAPPPSPPSFKKNCPCTIIPSPFYCSDPPPPPPLEKREDLINDKGTVFSLKHSPLHIQTLKKVSQKTFL